MTNIDFIAPTKRKLLGPLIEKLMIIQVGSGVAKPFTLFTGKEAFYRVNRFFAIWELHFYEEEDVAECVVFPVAHIDVEIVQLNGVMGFELEVNRLARTPSGSLDGLIAFEFTSGFARRQNHGCQYANR